MTSSAERRRARAAARAKHLPRGAIPKPPPSRRLGGLKTIALSQPAINAAIMSNRAKRIPVTLATLPPRTPED